MKETDKALIENGVLRMTENHVEYRPSPSLGDAKKEVYGGILGLGVEKMTELKAKK